MTTDPLSPRKSVSLNCLCPNASFSSSSVFDEAECNLLDDQAKVEFEFDQNHQIEIDEDNDSVLVGDPIVQPRIFFEQFTLECS